VEGDSREELAGFGIEHGWSKDGFSEATLEAHGKAKKRMADPRKPVEVILQEVVEASPLNYHVIVRFPSN
jgi:hypothetical protein